MQNYGNMIYLQRQMYIRRQEIAFRTFCRIATVHRPTDIVLL